MFLFASAKIGIHLPVGFLLSEIFCLWIWHAIAKRYNWWLLPQNIWNISNNNLICKSNNLTAASLKRKYWSVGLEMLHRNSRANFVAQQLTSKGRQHRGHTWANVWAQNEERAMSRKQKPRPHYYEQGPPSPRPQCIVYPRIPRCTPVCTLVCTLECTPVYTPV